MELILYYLLTSLLPNINFLIDVVISILTIYACTLIFMCLHEKDEAKNNLKKTLKVVCSILIIFILINAVLPNKHILNSMCNDYVTLYSCDTNTRSNNEVNDNE